MAYDITFDRQNWTATSGPKTMKGTYEEFIQEVNELADIHGVGPTWVTSAIDEKGRECKADFWAKSEYGFKQPEDYGF